MLHFRLMCGGPRQFVWPRARLDYLRNVMTATSVEEATSEFWMTRPQASTLLVATKKSASTRQADGPKDVFDPDNKKSASVQQPSNI